MHLSLSVDTAAGGWITIICLLYLRFLIDSLRLVDVKNNTFLQNTNSSIERGIE